jgi:hypothetical protein
MELAIPKNNINLKKIYLNIVNDINIISYLQEPCEKFTNKLNNDILRFYEILVLVLCS